MTIKDKTNPAINSLKKDKNFFADLLSDDSFTQKTKNADKKKDIHEKSEEHAIIPSSSNASMMIDPSEIKLYKYKDRPTEELGNIESLAKDMKINGQIQPCICRPCSAGKFKLELIIGERRWRAAQLMQMPLWVIIRDITDEEAPIIQAIENLHRENLSDWARGLNIATLLKNEVITQIQLCERLQMTVIQINRYLAFTQIPDRFWENVTKKTLISARTAAEIRAIANKGDLYVDVLIELAPSIESGKLGANKLQKKVEALVHKPKKNDILLKTYKDNNQKFLYSFKQEKNKNVSLKFNTEIKNKLDYNELEIIINQLLMNEIHKIIHVDNLKETKKE